ncbi:unnamed protein product, partial [Closterium sp. NIES-53]
LQPGSPLPAPSPYVEQTYSFTERQEPESRPASPVRAVRTGRRVLRPCPPPVPGTHAMALRPSSVPLRVPLPTSPESSLSTVPDPMSNLARAASPTVSRLLATVVTYPSFESTTAFALVAELVEFAAACCLDYALALVAESESDCPPSVEGECALGTDVLEDRQEDLECLAATVPRFASMLLALEGDPNAPDIPTRALTVKRPPGSPPAFKAHYVARGFSQRQGVDYFQTFSPTPKMTTLWQVYGLRQAPHEWHDTLRTTLAALGFTPLTADLSLFLRTDTWMPPFNDLVYVLQRFPFQFSLPQPTPLSTGHSLSAPPLDESIEPSGPYPELVGCLITSSMGLVLGGRGPVVLTGHADAFWVDDLATQRSSHGYTFSLGSGSVSWRSTRSSMVLSSSCEAEIYAWAMAALELRWLTYLLTDLGEEPYLPPVLYVENKAIIALCQEHRLEHRMEHIALRYFLSQELQQRGQLRLAYMATRANTADIFTKALQPACFAFLDWSCDPLFSPTLPTGCDSKDGLSLFNLTSGTSTAPAADTDSTVRSQWLTRDAAARLAVRNHLPSTERAHFSQYKSARALYDAVVARYSSPTTAALSRLMLPYLFPDLATFATVADLVAHLRTSDARYRTALPTEFLPTNSPPMYITLYYLVTRLPDSLSSVRDHFLSLCPTELTVDLLEERLAAAEKSILAVCASRGDRRTPFFEGCSPVPLLPSVASATAVDLVGTEEVGAASTPSGRRRTGKGKGSRGGGGGGGGSGGGGRGGGGGGSGSGGVGGGSGGRGGGGGGGGGGGSGGGSSGGGGAGRGAATQRGGLGGSHRQLQLHTRETPSVQQLREWYTGRGRSGGAGPWTYVLRTVTRSGENVPIFDLDFDAILAAMYALADITEGDYYLRVPPDPRTVAAALGASASAAPGAGTSPLSGTAPTESFHAFTLDSSASRSFFRDSTTLTPLSRPVAVSLADPSGGPVLAHSSTVLLCPAASSSLLSGLHLPSFSTNLVSGADLQDAWVDQFTPRGQRVTPCTCSRTGRHLATFTRRPGSSLYTLTTAPPPVSASGQVAASSQVFAAASRSSPASAPCSCRPLAHETLLWHHRLGHPSLPRLRGMASRALVSGLPSPSLPFLRGLPPPVFLVSRAGSAPPLTPPRFLRLRLLCRLFTWTCGAQPASVDRVTSATSSCSLTTTRVTPVFPLRSKGEVPKVLIAWIHGARRQLGESFGSDLPILRLHSDRGEEFSSDLLRAFCRSEGIRQMFTLPASPQQNGIAERRIGMYAAHQINLQPRVSLPVTTPTLRWTGKVGDASAFRVWGSRAFVRDTTADKLSSRAVRCVFLGFPPNAPGWQFYHPTSHRVLSSQDVTFDESVSYYHPAEPVEVAVDSGAARGAETGGAESGGAETGGAESGGAETGRAEPGGVAPEGTVSGGTEPARAGSGGALGVPSRREPLSPQRLCEWYSRRCRVAAGAGAAGAGAAGGAGAARGGDVAGAAEGATGAGAAGGAAGAGGARAAGAAVGAGGAGGATGGAGAAGGGAGAGAAGGAGGVGGAAGATGGAGAGAAGGAAGAGAAEGAAGAGAAGGATGTGDPGAEGTGSVSAVSGGAAQPRPYYVPLLQQVLVSLPSPGPPPRFLSPLPVQSQSQLHPASPLPGPSPYSGPTRGLTERREPESRPVSPESRCASPVRPVRAGCVSRPRLPPIPGTHSMTVRPSTAPQRVPLPSPHASSLPDGPDPESDSLRAASPTVTRFLATAVTDALFESSAASALVAELIDFAAACRLDYAASLVAESKSASVCPPSVGGECALGTDVLEDRQEDRECFAAASPHLVSMLLAPEGDPDALDIPTPRSYAKAIEGPYSSQWQAAPPPSTSGMGLVLGGRARVVLTGHADASWVDDLATQRSSQGYTFSLGSGSVSWRFTHSSSVLSSSCEAEIYTGAMAAQELRWLTYLLTDLVEAPRSPPVLYVDNKAMLALCQEHRLEHITKHIALRYFLARELQQRGQLRLAYVASQANTANVFTKALQPCDHQRFCTVFGLVPTVPHLLTS